MLNRKAGILPPAYGSGSMLGHHGTEWRDSPTNFKLFEPTNVAGASDSIPQGLKTQRRAKFRSRKTPRLQHIVHLNQIPSVRLMARIHCKTGIALLLSAVAFLPLSANAERVTLVCPNAISQRIILTFILDTEKNIVLSARVQSPTLDDIIFENLPLTSNDSEISWKYTWKLTYKQSQTNYYTLDRNTLELKTRSDLNIAGDQHWLCQLKRRQL